MASHKNTLEFFGTTTFRLKLQGLTILHDTWLEKPKGMKRWMELESVTELDYIVISHAHFDHLPGSDRLAFKTGARIIANCEAINRLRDAGVPEEQLIPVAGGERIPLFTRDTWEQAAEKTIELASGPPTAPARPHHKYAVAAVHVWPSLHSLLPGTTPHDIPECFDSAKTYNGSDTPFDCSLDVTRLMQYGLFRMKEIIPENQMNDGLRAFADFTANRKKNVMSHCDGGQMMYNFVVGDKSMLINSHLGAYEGIFKCMEPKPDIAILGAAGRANHNGRPFQGSAAQFMTLESKWLDEPSKIYLSLHDDCPIRPYHTNTTAAEEMLKAETRSAVIDTQPGQVYVLDI